MSDLPIGDPRPAGDEGPAGDQRPTGDDGPAGDPRPAGEGSGTATFDPSGHTVDEVLAHLDGASDAERERILDAETKGKGRAGILG